MQLIFWKWRKIIAPAKRLLTCCYQCWNVTKCRASDAKRHDNLLWHLRKGKVLQLPPKTWRGHRKTRDSRSDTWEHQNEHFVRDFLRFSQFAAWKSLFPMSSLIYESLNLLPQNRCFVRGFRQISSHLTKGHPCHGICTLSPLAAALTMRFAKNTQHDTSKVLRLPRKMKMDTSKVLRQLRKLQLILRKGRATQNDDTFYKTRLIVTKCHACHAKRSNPTCETSKSDPLLQNLPEARPYGPHADGCERLRAVANGCGRLHGHRRANTPSTPRPPEWNGNPCYTHSGFGKNHNIVLILNLT